VTPGTKVRTKVHLASVGLNIPAGTRGVVAAVLPSTSWPVEVELDGHVSHVFFARDELEPIE
jgi:hypothetical protein